MKRLLTGGVVLMCAASLCGCGQVSPKQVRIESSAVGSAATEGQTVASEYGQGRLGWTFAHVQFQTLAAQAGAPASSLGAGPAVPGVGGLASGAQLVALETQRQLNRLAARGRLPRERAAAEARLETLAKHATDIADAAEAIELNRGRDD